MIGPVGGAVPAEEQLVEAEGKQQKHHNHQEVPRILVSGRVGALLARPVVLVLPSKEAAEEA